MWVSLRVRGNCEQMAVCGQRLIHDSFDRHRWYERNISRRESRISHVGFILLSGPVQCVDAGDGFEPDFVFRPASGFDQVSRHTTETVSRTFGFTAIAIENSDCKNISSRLPKNQAVSADTKVSITDPACQFGMIRRNSFALLDKNEVVSERVSFDEPNHPRGSPVPGSPDGTAASSCAPLPV